MVASYVLYIFLFIFSFIFVRIARVENKKSLIYIVVIVLAVVAGFRGESVGLDTKQYLQNFTYLDIGWDRYVYGFEAGFKVLCKFLLTIVPSPQFLFFIYAFFTYYFLFIRLWELKDLIQIEWSVMGFFSVFYFLTLNILRQFLALSIIFWFTRYIQKKKTIIFILGVVLASQIHQSAFLGLVFLFYNIVYWKEYSKKVKFLYVMLFLCIPVGFKLILPKTVRYMGYFKSLSFNIGYMMIIKFFVIFVFAFLFYNDYHKLNHNKKRFYYYILILYLTGLTFTSLGYIVRFMERIGLYFYIFEIVYFGFLLKNTKSDRRIILKVILFVFNIFYFVSSLIGNGQGQSPYILCFS